MSYQTFFEGKLEVQLSQEKVGVLKEYLSQYFTIEEPVVVSEQSIVVCGEWKDRGLMEEVVLLVEKNGVLKSGKIRCSGEDAKDVWEIFIEENKPFIRELGSAITLSRTETKLQTVSA